MARRLHSSLLIVLIFLLFHCSMQQDPDQITHSGPVMTVIATDTVYIDIDPPMADPPGPDFLPPQITWDGPDTICIELSDPLNELARYIGDTAFHAEAPQGGTVVKEISHNVDIWTLTDTAPPYRITCSARDEAGNVSIAVRFVKVVPEVVQDLAPPVIVIGDDSVYTCAGIPPEDIVYSAYDLGDGKKIEVTKTGTVNYNVPGMYYLTFSAFDSRGNTASKICTVVVRECPLSVESGVRLP